MSWTSKLIGSIMARESLTKSMIADLPAFSPSHSRCDPHISRNRTASGTGFRHYNDKQ